MSVGDVVRELVGVADRSNHLVQESRVLAEVWLAYTEAPLQRHDLLLTVHRRVTSAEFTKRLRSLPEDLRMRDASAGVDTPLSIAFVEGYVAMTATFEQMLCCAFARTGWCWRMSGPPESGDDAYYLLPRTKPSTDPDAFRIQPDPKVHQYVRMFLSTIDSSDGTSGQHHRLPRSKESIPEDHSNHEYVEIGRILTMMALIEFSRVWETPPPLTHISDLTKIVDSLSHHATNVVRKIYGCRREMAKHALEHGYAHKDDVWMVTKNRTNKLLLNHSVPAVKADAARRLFDIDCSRITWAVLDSGIEAQHPAFATRNGSDNPHRITATYDFTALRPVTSLDSLESQVIRGELASELAVQCPLSEKTIEEYLTVLLDDAEKERPVNWELIGRLLEIDSFFPPENPHGTHVAGILGADWQKNGKPYMLGMCPEIRLMDFRVNADSIEDTEFAIIGALQFIQWLNDRNNYVSVHGINMSLGLPHDVRNYACGKTPVCEVSNRLVESGTVVVASAGNDGYRLSGEFGASALYQPISIMDPGNADGVITVGSTHARAHTYGVSYFSSRGPTGDGRLKPDLVAPGEKILAPAPNQQAQRLSGTSMSAPHVSGAAAMLMARNRELIGETRRIKGILMGTATDLSRERDFQGEGMLDILRAIQSI